MLKTDKQNCRTKSKMRSIVGDNTRKDLWMNKNAVEERAVSTHRGG
jgi:hypothetical protein